ncbi:RNA polymerase sigma factor [Lacrimispora indolis]|uniref:RNA polymerase sigma factor n=1 Tax=Lacrimispora indolis TaxID=69825 RepID=UPI0004151250|nr:sigma-70 family RNA polymerase sigma factor [[Clostridium] methoxybenzovorans]
MFEIYMLPNRLWECFSFLKKLMNLLLCFVLYGEAPERRKKAASREKALPSAQISQQAGRIMTDYGNNVLRLAYSYLHNMSDAEDVLQDTLIQFIKKQPRFETVNHEKAWVLRVAINISKNKITYNKIRKTDELSDTLAANETEDLSFVWDAVKLLPSKYREVVHLFYYEGYSTAQIASLLSKKEATVRSLLLRARIKLKEVLKEVYDFEE